jgi:arylsulfatase
MVMAWPARLRPDGPVRSQFTHVIDVAPTVLEAAGIPEPDAVDGIDQEPMDGTSFLNTVDDAAAPEQHTQQYFEMFGARAMYKDGWWSASRPDRLPWDLSLDALGPMGPDADWDPDRDVGWELYDLRSDFSQAHDVAAEHPEVVQELQEFWWKEAERNRVLPLMAGLSVLYGILPPLPTQTRFRFAGGVDNIQWGMIPRIFGRSYAIEADLVIPEGGAEGAIVAMADFIGGFGLWVDDRGRLRHTYSLLGVETYRQQSESPLPAGEVSVRMLFEVDEPKPGSGGTVTLFVNGEPAGGGQMPKTVPITFTSYAGMDISRDNGLVVDREYEAKAPYGFTGTVRQVTFDLQPVEAAAKHGHHEELHRHEQHQAVAAGAAS